MTLLQFLATSSSVARAPFLLLAVSCAGLGVAVAYCKTGSAALVDTLLVLCGAVCAHGGVNVLNEYFDFRSGLDALTTRTPFSGGSGTLPRQPQRARLALALSMVLCLVTCGIGLYFVVTRGWGLLPLGLAGMTLVLLYTPWLVRWPRLCTIAPGLGFGLIMVCGSEFALSGAYSWCGLLAALPVFFLTNNLLLLNQIPDLDADRRVGRGTLPIVRGVAASMQTWWVSWALAYAALPLGICAGLPWGAALALLPAPLALLVLRETRQIIAQAHVSTRALAANAAMAVLTPALLALGLLFCQH